MDLPCVEKEILCLEEMAESWHTESSRAKAALCGSHSAAGKIVLFCNRCIISDTALFSKGRSLPSRLFFHVFQGNAHLISIRQERDSPFSAASGG